MDMWKLAETEIQKFQPLASLVTHNLRPCPNAARDCSAVTTHKNTRSFSERVVLRRENQQNRVGPKEFPVWEVPLHQKSERA